MVAPILLASLFSQTPYISVQYSEPITPLAGGNLILGPGSFGDEARLIPIGFTFRFYDHDYDYVNVGENGALYFANSCAQGCTFNEFCGSSNVCEASFIPPEFGGLPNPQEPNRMIAAFWDDLWIEQTAPASEIRYGLRGNAPNRELVVEWRNIRHFPDFFPPDSRISFQIRLEEGTDTIRLHYGGFTSGQSNIAWSGIIGIEDGTGTNAVFPLACGASATCSWVDLNGLNNQVLQISVPNAPELTGSVGAPHGAAPGATASFPVTAHNVGLQPTGTGFAADVYLSTDRNIVPGADTLLGTVSFGPLAAGATATATLTTTIPNITQAYYTVGAVIDSNNVINEPVETNNVVLAPGTFLVGRDLSASFPNHPGLPPGQNADVMFDLVNESSAIASVEWQVYLSTDTIRDPGDYLLASGASPAPASSSTRIVRNVPIPALAPGTYRLIAVVDPNNAVAEIDEFDNEVPSGPVLVGPDLAIFTILSPETSGAGATLPVTVLVQSEGSPVPSTGLEVYLSTDRTLDASDWLVFTGTVAAPSAETVPAQVPLTLGTGDYFLIARVDPSNAILEVSETNNLFVTVNTIRLIGPDLAAIDIDVPDPAFRGQPYRLRGTIENQGGSPLHGFYAGFYLSDNELITISDRLLTEVGPFDLEPGAALVVDETITFPTDVATAGYFIGFVADSRESITEEREINNIRRTSSRITVRDIAPDFMASEIIAPVSAGSGESFYVQRVLENRGNDAGTADFLIFLVLEGTSVRVAVLGHSSVSLEAGALDEGADLVTVPADVAPGDYRVEYSMDPEDLVEELDEGNNEARSSSPVTLEPAQLAIISGAPSLAVIGVDYEFDLVARGGTGPLTWSITQGSLPAGLALDPSSGRITGVPTTEGVSTFGIRVSDGALFHERAIAIRVIAPTVELRIVTRAVPPAFAGTAYDFPLVAIGGVEPYNYHVDPALPAGLALTGEGHISGTTATVAPALVYTFSVTDATGAEAETLIAFRVLSRDRSVRFGQSALPDGLVGEPYDAPLSAVGGIQPYTFALASGALPDGLSIANGRLAGLPSVVGTYIFELSVTDDAKDADRNLYVVRIEADAKIQFVTRSLPAGTVGDVYLDSDGDPVRIRAIAPGSTSSVSYALLDGELPPGLSLAPDGTLSGTPDSAGVFPFVVMASEPSGGIDLRAFGVVIDEPAKVTTDDGGCGCTAAGTGAAYSLLWILLLLPFAFRRRSFLPAVLLLAMVPSIAHAQATDAGPPPPPPPLDGGVGPDAGFDGGLPDGGGGPGSNTPYFITEYTEAYSVRSGGTVLQPFNADDGQATAALPFPFRFFDQTYNSVEVGTNGYVTFDFDGSSLGNQALPDQFSPNTLIALFWDDLISPQMSLTIEGTQPNRIAVIQWEGSYHFPGGTGELMSMQLWLYEGLAGRFEVHYGPMTGLTGAAFFDATAGFENQSGTVAYNLRSCSPTCSANDLQNLSGVVFRALQDAGEDVFATDIAPVDTVDPIRVYQALPFDVRLRVSSYHLEPLGPFQYAVHLVDPSSGELLMPAVLTSTAITLGPYEDRETVESVTIPLTTPPGRYRLALVVDSANALAEPNESNNVVMSRREILVGERRPDFTVGSVIPSQATAEPGGVLDVDLELRNAGNFDGATAWRVVLSGNSSPSVDDVIGSESAVDEPLPVGMTKPLNATLDIPADLTPGLYYVGVVVDPANTVRELNEVNNFGVSSMQVQIGQGALQILTTSLPIARLGLEYRTTLAASGATGEYTWSVAGGALPEGIALAPETGDLIGTPQAAGSYSVTFRATSGTATQDATFDLMVAPIDGPLTIVTRRLLPGIVGLVYPPRSEEEQRIVAVGGAGPATFTNTSSLPPGLMLDGDGFLHGVPQTAGDFYVDVEAFDGAVRVQREIPLTVVEPGRLTLIGEQLPDAVNGVVYAHQLVVIGDNPADPPIFSLAAGRIPSGLMLSGQGELSGTPNEGGAFVFNVEVREGSSGAKDSATFYLSVTAPTGLDIMPGSLPVATLNQAYEVVLTAQGGAGAIEWTLELADDLPRGLSDETVEIDGAMKLRIFGTPEELPEGGAVGMLVRAVDAEGRSKQAAYALSVIEPVVQTKPDEGGCGCSAAGPEAGGGIWWLVLAGLGLLLRRGRKGLRLSLLLVLTGACDCGDGGGLTELKPMLVAPERVDFHDVGLGIEKQASLVLENDGEGTLRIASRDLRSDLEDFRIVSVIPDSISAKQSVEVTLAFTPIQLGDSSGTLTIVADDDEHTHVIQLVGKGVVPGIEVQFAAPACDGVNGSLSFGSVAPGSIATVPLVLRAVGSQAVTVNASRVAENTSNEFGIEPVEEATVIAPGESLSLSATYQPSDTGTDTAAFIIETDAPGSRTVRIPVCGQGAAPTLCAEPLDLGRVAVGSNASGTIVVTNCGSDPVDVTGVSMSTNPASHPSYSVGTVSPSLPSTLAPGDTVDVEVRLVASTVGTREGWVHVVSTSPETPNVFFHVTAEVADTCGLDVVPGRLVFPSVLVGSSERRNVLLANAGSDPCAITRVAITSGASVFTLRDPFNVPRELAPGLSDVLVVRYAPTLPGAADVGVLEIEAGTRVHRIDLLGNPPLQPGCQLDVTPDYINWGTVNPGMSVTRSVLVKNIGISNCTLVGAELDAASSAAFTNVATQPGLLAPGMDVTVLVTFRARPTGTDMGTLRITTDDVDSPVFEVGLFGATAAPGICVLPRDVDFGMTMNGIETFRIWACGAQPVTITDLTFSRPDDEFTFDAPPALPAVLQPNEDRVITVHYTSADDVGDSAVITVGSNDPVEPLIRVNVVAGPVIVPPSAGRFIYYWQIDTFGPDQSNIMRIPLQGAPIPETFWGPRLNKPCSGCHGVSPDGRYVSLIEADTFTMQIIDTQTNVQVALPFQAPNAAYVTWNPDPNTNPPYQFAYDDGDRVHIASVVGGYIGELQGANDPVYGSKMPSWGPNHMIAFARGQPGGGWGFFGSADIMLVDENGGVPVPVSGASGGGGANYYPAFHPNGQWIAFTQSLSAQGTISAPDATVKLVAADQSGMVLDLPALNCAPGTCGSSFPTWSLDGEFLSFSSNRPGGAGGWDMYISDIDPISGAAMPPFNIVEANTPMFEHAARWSD